MLLPRLIGAVLGLFLIGVSVIFYDLHQATFEWMYICAGIC